MTILEVSEKFIFLADIATLRAFHERLILGNRYVELIVALVKATSRFGKQ